MYGLEYGPHIKPGYLYQSKELNKSRKQVQAVPICLKGNSKELTIQSSTLQGQSDSDKCGFVNLKQPVQNQI